MAQFGYLGSKNFSLYVASCKTYSAETALSVIKKDLSTLTFFVNPRRKLKSIHVSSIDGIFLNIEMQSEAEV